MLLRKINNFFEFEYFDKQLFFSVIVLILIGLLMVASTSITISKPVYGESFKIFFKQLISVVIGFILAAALFKTSIKK